MYSCSMLYVHMLICDCVCVCVCVCVWGGGGGGSNTCSIAFALIYISYSIKFCSSIDQVRCMASLAVTSMTYITPLCTDTHLNCIKSSYI